MSPTAKQSPGVSAHRHVCLLSAVRWYGVWGTLRQSVTYKLQPRKVRIYSPSSGTHTRSQYLLCRVCVL